MALISTIRLLFVCCLLSALLPQSLSAPAPSHLRAKHLAHYSKSNSHKKVHPEFTRGRTPIIKKSKIAGLSKMVDLDKIMDLAKTATTSNTDNSHFDAPDTSNKDNNNAGASDTLTGSDFYVLPDKTSTPQRGKKIKISACKYLTSKMAALSKIEKLAETDNNNVDACGTSTGPIIHVLPKESPSPYHPDEVSHAGSAADESIHSTKFVGEDPE